MDTNKILLIFGLILLLFLIMRNTKVDTSTSTPSTTTTKVVYRHQPVVASNGKYNAYKAQYYN